MNAFSVLVQEFIVSRAHLLTQCNSKSRLQPVLASAPLRWSDERSLSFFQDTAEVLHHPHNMKQITKPIRIPSESHFITAGKGTFYLFCKFWKRDSSILFSKCIFSFKPLL